MSTEPRIITLTGLPHPQARIDRVDPAAGLAIFAFLEANAQPVDSGGSVATFTPLDPLPAEEGEPVEYPEASDEVLAAAIAAAVNAPAPVPQVISRAEFVIAARRVLGITEGAIHALISQLPAGETQETARDLWENAREFRRDNSFLAALAQLNGNTAAEIDEVFRTGAALDLD
jgi:hypothetical protein